MDVASLAALALVLIQAKTVQQLIALARELSATVTQDGDGH
jgi:hypothetical protein